MPIIPPKNTHATAGKWHAGSWRHRDTAAAAAPFAEPAPPSPPPPAHSLNPDPLAECWAIANPDVEASWFERWGRSAAAWSGGLAAAVLVAGGAAWVYNDSKTSQALSVASAALDTPLPAYVTRAPIGPVEPIAVQASELPPLAIDFQAAVPDFSPAPVAAKRSRVRAIAKVPRRTPPPAPDPAAIRQSQKAETLRQCRAAGYHAGQCIKRSCVATPYGIACKG
ncbi:hypothetical protein HHL21_16415 [Massilia sp. RP-1-19]|uniref:Uncharacterized protein n=1 Tax=Massilia polaris TaxID=2728846 RepID=A0A848HSB2_9BURK|nr:hypothetical protein [Massilia polaris]NML62631.1 hypothetical protein [Massilia polaris]